MANSEIFDKVREVLGKPVYYATPEVQVFDNVHAIDNKLTTSWPDRFTTCSLPIQKP